MAFTHKVGITYNAGDGQIAGVTNTYTADSESGFDGTVVKSTTNAEVDVAIDVSALVSLCLYSDNDITIKTNSSSAPDDTIAVKAKQPTVWTSDGDADCPLTVDVTKLFITNASSTVDAKVRLRWLVDVTP